jgi:hypothetical protein
MVGEKKEKKEIQNMLTYDGAFKNKLCIVADFAELF